MQRKSYVIGDVHGCYHTLVALLNKLPKNAKIIFVGDLCDRGLYTKDVIALIMEKGYDVILGNHDEYMIKHAIECLTSFSCRWYSESYMGGKETMVSYENELNTLYKHIEWLKTLPRYIMIENYFITHSFALPYYKRRDMKEAFTGLLKNRVSDEEVWGDEWEKDWKEYNVINIFGHTHYEQVEVKDNYYGIDTGCVYGGELTAIELQTMKSISVALDSKDILLK